MHALQIHLLFNLFYKRQSSRLSLGILVILQDDPQEFCITLTTTKEIIILIPMQLQTWQKQKYLLVQISVKNVSC